MNEEDYTPTIPRIFNRHTKRTCEELEGMNCPEGHKENIKDKIYEIRAIMEELEGDLEREMLLDMFWNLGVDVIWEPHRHGDPVYHDHEDNFIVELRDSNCGKGHIKRVARNFGYICKDLIAFAEMESAGNY